MCFDCMYRTAEGITEVRQTVFSWIEHKVLPGFPYERRKFEAVDLGCTGCCASDET